MDDLSTYLVVGMIIMITVSVVIGSVIELATPDYTYKIETKEYEPRTIPKDHSYGYRYGRKRHY